MWTPTIPDHAGHLAAPIPTDLPSPGTRAAEVDALSREHVALGRLYGAAQQRCSHLLAAAGADRRQLEAEIVRLRGVVIARDTALAIAREDRAAFEAQVDALPPRITLARRVKGLVARVQALMRERLRWQWHGTTPAPATAHRRLDSVLCVGGAAQALSADALRADTDNLAALEASLVAADLVICQTGCLSHGAYWRVQDHCRRTGKTCVMADAPQVVHIVRTPAGAAGSAR